MANKKKELKTSRLVVRITDEQLVTWTLAAIRDNETLSEWVRKTLDKKSKKEIIAG